MFCELSRRMSRSLHDDLPVAWLSTCICRWNVCILWEERFLIPSEWYPDLSDDDDGGLLLVQSTANTLGLCGCDRARRFDTSRLLRVLCTLDDRPLLRSVGWSFGDWARPVRPTVCSWLTGPLLPPLLSMSKRRQSFAGWQGPLGRQCCTPCAWLLYSSESSPHDG